MTMKSPTPPLAVCPVCDCSQIWFSYAECPAGWRRCDVVHCQPICMRCHVRIQRYDQGESAHEFWASVLLGYSNREFGMLHPERPIIDWGIGHISLSLRDPSSDGELTPYTHM